MGNREDLIESAKRALFEKGYSRTTARDIATGAGVSLAAIGYHFNSKDALMNEALFQVMEEWSEEVERALSAGAGADLGPEERFARIWDHVIESVRTNRKLWMASFEIFPQIDQLPQVKTQLANAIAEGRRGLAELFQGLDQSSDDPAVDVVGSFYYALMSGLLIQWLVDPDRAPSGRDLATALRLAATHLHGTAQPVARS